MQCVCVHHEIVMDRRFVSRYSKVIRLNWNWSCWQIRWMDRREDVTVSSWTSKRVRNSHIVSVQIPLARIYECSRSQARTWALVSCTSYPTWLALLLAVSKCLLWKTVPLLLLLPLLFYSHCQFRVGCRFECNLDKKKRRKSCTAGVCSCIKYVLLH